MMNWIPGSLNLADPLTKPDSPLTHALALTLYTGRLCVVIDDEAESKSCSKFNR